MTLEEILQVYDELITNPIKLQKGEQILNELINTVPNFCSQSIKLVITNEIDSSFRKIIGYIMKNLLKDNWKINARLENEKQMIKEGLVQGLALNYQDPKIVEVLAISMAELIKHDGIDHWESLLKEIIEWMCTEDNQIIDAALECLCIIFNEVDNGMHNIVPSLLQNLLKIFMFPELTEVLREKLLILLYLAIQSISWADGVDRNVIETCFMPTYNEWMSLFISSLQISTKKHINIKRYIIKILTVIFRDLSNYSVKSINMCIQPIWKFLNNNLPLFLWVVVHGIPIQNIDENLKPINLTKKQSKPVIATQPRSGFELEEDMELTNDVEGLTTQLVELMITLISRPNLHALLKFGLYPLVNVLSHYLWLTKEQEKLWQNNPNQFISDEQDEFTLRNLRTLILKLISDLIEQYGDDATQSIVMIAEKFILNLSEDSSYTYLQSLLEKLSGGTEYKSLQDFDAEKLLQFIKTSHFECDHPDTNWKKKETGLLLLGTFSEDIIASKARKSDNFDIAQLLQNLIDNINNKNANPVLRGRTFWCISKYSDLIGIKQKEIFLSLFKTTSECLTRKNCFPVRLSAAKTLRILSYKIEKAFGTVLPEDMKTKYDINNKNNLISYVELLDLISDENIHLVLEGILFLNKLNSGFLPKTGEIMATRLLEIFKRLHYDMNISPIIFDLVKIMCSDSASFLCIHNAFLSFMLQALSCKSNAGNTNSNSVLSFKTISKMNESGLISSMLDVIKIFVRMVKDPKPAEELVSMLQPLLALMMENEDVNLQTHAVATLKTFIMYQSESIMKQSLMQPIIAVLNKILLPSYNESASLYAGNLVIMIFANLMKNSVDVNILKAIVAKIFKSKMPSIIQSLVLVFARLININEKEMLTFLTSFSLEGRIALKVIIDKWLLHQPLFRGKHTKTATYLALTKLFLAKDDRLEQLLVIGYNPSHSNLNSQVYAPLKIISLLLRCLDHEISQMQREPERPAMGGNTTYKMKRSKENQINENGRIDTLGDESCDDDDDGEGAEMLDGDDFEDNSDDDDGDASGDYDGDNTENKINVDINPQKDEEDYELNKKFDLGIVNRGGGLGDFDTESAFYYSDMLDFERDDGEEADEIAEEDLIFLKDPCIQLDLVALLRDFFTAEIQHDYEYLSACLKNLLPEDKERFKKFFKLNI